jgi:hypothetical protein
LFTVTFEIAVELTFREPTAFVTDAFWLFTRITGITR